MLYADKSIFNRAQIESVHRKEQLATIYTVYRINTIVYDEFNAISPTERIAGSFEHKPLRSLSFINGNRDSTSLLFAPFFYSLCRPATASQCMASVYK